MVLLFCFSSSCVSYVPSLSGFPFRRGSHIYLCIHTRIKVLTGKENVYVTYYVNYNIITIILLHIYLLFNCISTRRQIIKQEELENTKEAIRIRKSIKGLPGKENVYVNYYMNYKIITIILLHIYLLFNCISTRRQIIKQEELENTKEAIRIRKSIKGLPGKENVYVNYYMNYKIITIILLHIYLLFNCISTRRQIIKQEELEYTKEAIRIRKSLTNFMNILPWYYFIYFWKIVCI